MNISTAKDILNASALAGDSVLIEGKHGIGKSQIFVQFAEENDFHLEVLFLSHQEVGDLIGIPHTIEIDGVLVTTWSVPIWLQRMRKAAAQGKRCVLFLDELNRAPIDVRQSSLQLVLEGKIHEHELPIVDGHKTFVGAAINPSDDYQVDELDPALLDRFLNVFVEPDAKAWLNWAREKNINPVIRDFIAENPDRIHWTPADGGIGTTPRSWAKLGDFLDKSDLIKEEILFQIMKGKIGTEIGAQFYSFFKNYVNVIKVEDIEKLVSKHHVDEIDVEFLSDKIRDLVGGTEAIQKTELAVKLKDKYGEVKNAEKILPFMAYLYSMDVELLVGFLKGLRKDEPKVYSNIAAVDSEINNKELFRRIVSAANKV